MTNSQGGTRCNRRTSSSRHTSDRRLSQNRPRLHFNRRSSKRNVRNGSRSSTRHTPCPYKAIQRPTLRRRPNNNRFKTRDRHPYRPVLSHSRRANTKTSRLFNVRVRKANRQRNRKRLTRHRRSRVSSRHAGTMHRGHASQTYLLSNVSKTRRRTNTSRTTRQSRLRITQLRTTLRIHIRDIFVILTDELD